MDYHSSAKGPNLTLLVWSDRMGSFRQRPKNRAKHPGSIQIWSERSAGEVLLSMTHKLDHRATHVALVKDEDLVLQSPVGDSIMFWNVNSKACCSRRAKCGETSCNVSIMGSSIVRDIMVAKLFLYIPFTHHSHSRLTRPPAIRNWTMNLPINFDSGAMSQEGCRLEVSDVDVYKWPFHRKELKISSS